MASSLFRNKCVGCARQIASARRNLGVVLEGEALASRSLGRSTYLRAGPQATTQHRAFSNSHQLGKKKDKHAIEPPAEPASDAKPNKNDPFDFTELHEKKDKAIERLREELSKLRTGGKFNVELVEKLGVRVDKAGNSAAVGDLAQCVPKGRNLTVLVGEQAVS